MNAWISHVSLGVVAFAAGYFLQQVTSPPEIATTAPADEAVVDPARAPGVTGVGGIFFRSDDPAGVSAWYRERLGVGVPEGTFVFRWLEEDDPEELGYTVWGVFPASTEYFAPSDAPYMINFRVENLPVLLEDLRSAGVEVVGELEEYPNGSFAWILDPEGRKIELWEPVPSADDPYIG